MKYSVVCLLAIGLTAAVQAADTCPKLSDRASLKPGKAVCCDGVIKNVVETGMKTLDLFPVSGTTKSLSFIVQSISHFVQKHFGIAFEIIMASKEFALNTHYNGTKLCKFESNNYILAAYETPAYYDINSPSEAYFYNFAADDKLQLKSSLGKVQNKVSDLGSSLTGGFGGFGKK